MDAKIKQLFKQEIMNELQILSSMNPGDKEKITAIDRLLDTYCKLEIENNDEVEFKYVQLKEQARDRYLRFGLDVASIIFPLVFYAVWMRRGFKFEETGTYTSTTFRGLFNRFKPTK